MLILYPTLYLRLRFFLDLEKANAINYLHKYYNQRNLRDSLKRSDEFAKNKAELKLNKQKKDLDEAKMREGAMLYSYIIYGGFFIAIILILILILNYTSLNQLHKFLIFYIYLKFCLYIIILI